jgi:hypothetical protein
VELLENFSFINFDNYSKYKKRHWDLFITCGSFELRCIRSSEILKTNNITVSETIIFNYVENDNRGYKTANVITMQENLKSSSAITHIFDSGSVSLPSEGIKNFFLFLSKNNVEIKNKTILLDITVFTKPYFFLLCQVLLEKFKVLNIDVLYTGPEKYADKPNETDIISLTNGIDRIVSLPGFSGSSIKSKTALIVIMGFEGKRSMEIFDNVNPDITYAINGFPSLKSGWHKESLYANSRFLYDSDAYKHLFYSSSIDPFETQKTVDEIIKEIQNIDNNFNVIIAPLGTKVQAFGVMLHSFLNKSTKVIYPFPTKYNIDFSYKWGNTWIFRAKFDSHILTHNDTL